MLWVLKRTVSFEHPKQMLKLMGKKIFTIFTLKFFVDLNLDERFKLQLSFQVEHQPSSLLLIPAHRACLGKAREEDGSQQVSEVVSPYRGQKYFNIARATYNFHSSCKHMHFLFI